MADMGGTGGIPASRPAVAGFLRRAAVGLAGPALLVLAGPVAANEDGVYDLYSAGCTGCHTGGGNTAIATLQFFNGSTYTTLSGGSNINKSSALRLRLQTNAANGGFNLRVNRGTITSGSDSSTNASFPRQLTHDDVDSNGPGGGKEASGGFVVWDFDWSGTSLNNGTTFEFCANPVDGDGFADAGDGDSDCESVTVDVVNRAPIATDDTFTVVEDDPGESLAVLTDGVNDSDPDGDSFSITAVGTPNNGGSVSINGSTLTYSPATNFDGPTETFTYTIADSEGAQDSATVTVTITPVNDPPTITQGTTIARTTSDNTPLGFVLSAAEVDSADNVAATQWSVTQPANGTASLSAASGASVTVTYTPDPGYVNRGGPTDDFTVTVSDGNTPNPSSTSTVQMRVDFVDDAPVIADPDGTDDGVYAITIDEDNSPTAFALTLTGSDADTGQTLTWRVTTPASSGVAVASGTGTSQVVGYTPATDFFGSDSFVVELSDGTGSDQDTLRIDVTVDPRNDAPAAVADPDFTVAVASTDNALDVLANDSDPENATLSITAAGAASAGGTVSVNPTSDGLLYTPPADFAEPAPLGKTDTFTYTITDNDATAPGPQSATATVTVRPNNADGDGVIDFHDNCPGVANTGQENNDGDGEGDACDDDDDNDGMSDVDENNETDYPNCLDPFTPDADLDCDGDGRSNGEELAGGFDPTRDDVAPVVTAPNAIAIDATGFRTAVDLGSSSSNDVLAGAVTAVPRLSVTADAECTTGTRIERAHAFKPGRHTVYWTARDDAGNCGFATQRVDVRPLASLAPGQQVAEGRSAAVDVTLNGDAPQYPVTLSYRLGGTAVAEDYTNAASGSLRIDAGRSASFTLTTVADALGEGDETVVVTLAGATNAALGRRSHTVTIVEGNAAPRIASLTAQQAPNPPGTLVVQGGGSVTVSAAATDPNGDVLSFDWGASSDALAGTPAGNAFTFDPAGLVAGRAYRVAVAVSDGAGGAASATLLVTVVASAPVLGATDSDGDGTNDDDEGFGDSDGDGIPEYLDDAGVPPNLVQTQTDDPSSVALLETEDGLSLRLGATARYALRGGASLTEDDIARNGGPDGSATGNADDGFENVGGLFDFEIAGLTPGAGARIVVPLRPALRAGAEYRKYTPGGGWAAFVEDDDNRVFSAASRGGVCPGPGERSYRAGLAPFHDCVQLLIRDGGPNDADATADGVIRDPGGPSVRPQLVATRSVPKGSAALQPLWLLVLGVLCLVRCRR